MAFPDLDVSHPSAEEVKAFTDATTALEATANTVRTQRDEIQRGASGNAINVQTSVLTDIEQKIRDAATKTAKVAAAMKVLRDAGDTWLKVAPKKKEIEAAEKEVETARLAMMLAVNMGVPSSPAAAQLEAAKAKLRELVEKRRAADEAYNAACKKAAGMVSAPASAGPGVVADQGGGTGRTRPGGDSKPESGAPPGGTPPAAPSGPPTPAHRPAPGAPKPSTGGGGTPSPSKPGGTPAATPSAEKPATSTLTSATPTSADQALAALLAQQRGQGSGAPATAGLPLQQTQQAKPAEDKATDAGDSARPIDSASLSAFLNTPLNSGDGTSSNSTRVSTPSPSSTPPSSGAGTSFRPDFTAPKALGGGGVPAQPAVTGTSVTGVQTGADVSGRSTPTPGAFTNPASNASTGTSAAHGGPSEQAPSSSRPTSPGGTPVGGMPIGGMPMGGGGGGGRSGKNPGDRGVLAENPLLDGTAAIEAAVKHGTIIRKDDP
ncbi:hypothetical protein [Tsukamurella pulmonis]|uniref:hypothetical protein n=1 Tax=Tsukamurella pulmonis TaxID=47312 RepID=UPI000E0928D3|nr:hypothetical protein [Tsukamurella pulmonis]RDH13759.1 hypothetical protein DVB88_00855 [Tsukamurella pulmonis]